MSRTLAWWVLLCCALSAGDLASAQVPADPSNYSRTTSYSYNADGTLHSTTVEPDNLPSCHVTTVSYDAHGNIGSSTLANCQGATDIQLFVSRQAGASFDAVASQGITTGGSLTANATVTIPAGLVQTSATNALGQQSKFQVDPRFGVATQSTDIDQRVSKVIVDDFGRTIKQVKPDGTSVRSFYCVLASSGLDTSSNTAGCAAPVAPEVPTAYAVRFVQTEPHDSTDTKMGPFVRVYYDRLDRVIRTATESFDGDNQPAARKDVVVVSDVVYDANGGKQMDTRPYFLSSGSTTVAGANDAGVTRYAYDALGRTTATYVSDPDSTAGNQQTFGGTGPIAYGVYGTRTVATTTFSFSGTSTTTKNDLAETQTAERDARGQVVRKTDTTGAQLAFQYDAFGNVIRIVDALQNAIATTYDIRGAKTAMNDPDHGVIVYCYDVLGQLKAQQGSQMRGGSTPDTPQSCPTGLTSATAAVAKTAWATFAYDQLGRTTQRIEPDLTATWTYDSCTNGVGELCQVATSSGATKTFAYDSAGRLIDTRLDATSGPSFASAVAFDAKTGRLATKTYPSGLRVAYGYTALGFAQKLLLNTAATVAPLPDAQGHVANCPAQTPGCASLSAGSALWSATTVDAASAWESQSFGNGVAEAVSQNPATGRIWSRTASVGGSATVLNQSYTWDGVNNVLTRTDNIGGGTGAITESFHYDKLNRLSFYSVSSPGIPNFERDVTLQYNALGMLLSKTDVGNYTYASQGGRHPHALVSNDGTGATYGVDLDGNVVTATTGRYTNLTYTSFDNVATATGNGSNYTWVYDESHGRMKETRTSGGDTRVTWYLNPDNAGALAFEVETDTSPAAQNSRHYLTVNGNVIGVLVTAGSLPALTTGQMVPTAPGGPLTIVKVEYWHKDHLGSLAATTDYLGNVTDRYSYDPFGKRRYTDGRYDPTNQVVADWSPSVNYGTARGFTGHEQLDDIGIVNMNGRLYDARLGMFVQADPHVTNAENLQNYNRYAYLLNNPLNGADPTGFDGPNPGDDPGDGDTHLMENVFPSQPTAAPGQNAPNLSEGSGNSLDASDGNRSNRVQDEGIGSSGCSDSQCAGGSAKGLVDSRDTSDSKEDRQVAQIGPLVEPIIETVKPEAVAPEVSPPEAAPDTMKEPPPGYTPYSKLPQGSAKPEGGGKSFPRSFRKTTPDGRPCYICNRATTRELGKPNTLEGEHIVPRSGARPPTPAEGQPAGPRGPRGDNSRENYEDSCHRCNNEKRDRTPQQYYKDMNWAVGRSFSRYG